MHTHTHTHAHTHRNSCACSKLINHFYVLSEFSIFRFQLHFQVQQLLQVLLSTTCWHAHTAGKGKAEGERERGHRWSEGEGVGEKEFTLSTPLVAVRAELECACNVCQLNDCPKVLHTHTSTHTACASSLTFDFYCQLEGEWRK